VATAYDGRTLEGYLAIKKGDIVFVILFGEEGPGR